jgi:7-cyano-7-deazaguanine synthase in queuosine biosynthesis
VKLNSAWSVLPYIFAPLSASVLHNVCSCYNVIKQSVCFKCRFCKFWKK